MILKRVESENVLKYRRLLLADLPAHGQIAVAGPNEAGKTAIGETVCLGLFGRTFSLGPDDLDKAIRWGQYRGSVRVDFTGSDGGDYYVVREIDNTGKHKAVLFILGEQQPVAEGPDAVADAIHELGGFTFKSFIDSFYLAQREMEVPHGKSATVKALIGVDRLETAATELKTEVSDTAAAIATLEAEIRGHRQEIARVNLDRAQLGRLESQRDVKAKEASATDAEGDELTARSESIGKASNAFVDAARKFVESTPNTNYGQWRDRKQHVAGSMVAAAKAAKASQLDAGSQALETTGTAIKTFESGLAEYDQVRRLAGLYRQRLAYLLDERPSCDAPADYGGHGAGEPAAPYPQRRAAAVKQADAIMARRKLLLVLGVFFVELALLAWVGWAVLMAAPESTIGGWLQAVIVLGESGRRLLLLLSAITGTAITAVFGTHYLRVCGQLRECQRQIRDLDDETQTARAEMGVIDAIDDAPLANALEALRCVRNDLLNSAVVSFSKGDGAVLVRPDAQAAKLAEIRDGATGAARSLKQAQRRIADRAAELKKRAMELRVAITHLDAQIEEERQRWEQVEVLERTAACLETKAAELHHRITVRKLACELIDKACRRIYSRFHPELRRFVTKLLPRLTEDRYEHLELDDDLRVRVFCKEKNDFVGLTEISNGTHRQLMLCVRLALSQALIASSSKAAQFLFFDEPFAFFDERRMAKAIDVLRKISPQITQVWLAAQKFDNPDAFDMFLRCEVENDCLQVSGKGTPGVNPAIRFVDAPTVAFA